jgi:hypothetical protein
VILKKLKAKNHEKMQKKENTHSKFAKRGISINSTFIFKAPHHRPTMVLYKKDKNSAVKIF